MVSPSEIPYFKSNAQNIRCINEPDGDTTALVSDKIPGYGPKGLVCEVPERAKRLV